MATVNTQQGQTFAGYTTLETRACPICGVLYAAPERLFDYARDHGSEWYCPNGHNLVFTETNEQKLQRKEEELARARRREAATRELLRAEERSHAATRGHVTRAKKQLSRIGNGVCPCCKRHFTNVERHMASKHPGFES